MAISHPVPLAHMLILVLPPVTHWEMGTPTPTISYESKPEGGACLEMHTAQAMLTQLIISRRNYMYHLCSSISSNWRAAAPKCYHKVHSKMSMM